MSAPAPRASASAKADHRGPTAALMFVLAWLWLSLRPSALLQEDTSRDLAFARDLVDGTQLHLHGAWASFVSIHQGTSWIDFLALCELAGLSVVGIERVLSVLLAASVALAYLGFTRLLPPREDPLVGRLAPVVGGLVLLAALPMVCEVPILWQPTLLPVPIVLAHLSLWRLLRDGELVDALALAVLCGLAFDIHVVSAGLLLLALAAVPLASKRPLISTPLALALCLGTLALCSPAAFTANLGIMKEQGWLIPSLAVAAVSVLAGALARGRFAALAWESRLRVALGVELVIVAAIVVASMLPSTPALTGRYLLPFAPALALALALAASWAKTRRSMVASLVLALTLLLASMSWLRPAPERILPIYPEWSVAEFEPVAELLTERELTWTELAGSLQGPSYAMVLGYLSAIVEPGSSDPAAAEAGLLLLALELADAERALAELPQEFHEDPLLLTTIDADDMRVVLLRTPARTQRHGMQLCRDGQDCAEVELAVTSRVYQAHATAWIGPEPAHLWLVSEGRGEPSEILWRVPVSPGPAASLMLTSVLPEHCAWAFVAAEGFEPSTSLPSHLLELPAEAEGWLLLSRDLDPDEWACREHGLFPPAIIETEPEWVVLRELLAPPW